MSTVCSECQGPIGQDEGPPDVWHLDDGRTVCQACCMSDTVSSMDMLKATIRQFERKARKEVGHD